MLTAWLTIKKPKNRLELFVVYTEFYHTHYRIFYKICLYFISGKIHYLFFVAQESWQEDIVDGGTRKQGYILQNIERLYIISLSWYRQCHLESFVILYPKKLIVKCYIDNFIHINLMSMSNGSFCPYSVFFLYFYFLSSLLLSFIYVKHILLLLLIFYFTILSCPKSNV